MTDLGTIGAQIASEGNGINNLGQVVGIDFGHGFLYSNGDKAILTPPEISSQANGVNNLGQVVGATLTPVDPDASDRIAGQHAAVFSNGTWINLDNSIGGNFSVAYAINDSGQVVGEATLSGDANEHAFLYSNGAMKDLGALFLRDRSTAMAINNSGSIVGYSLEVNSHGFLYADGKMYDLNSVIDPAHPGLETTASDINDLGQIVGSFVEPDGSTHAFLATPVLVPEPAGALLLVIGATAAGRRTGRG